MTRLTGFLFALFLGAASVLLTAAVWTAKGTTHHVFLGVTEQTTPTADPNDRPIIEFIDHNGNRQIVVWRWTTRVFVVSDPNGRDPNGTALS